MSQTNSKYVSFEALGKAIGVSPASLFSDYKAFNKALPADESIGEKTVNKSESRGISFRNASNRINFLKFLEVTYPKDDDLPKRIETEFFASIDEGSSKGASPFEDKVFLENPEIFETIYKFLQIRGVGNDLTRNLDSYADHYYLVRKTSRDADYPYYEEPFRIGGHGDNSYLIPRSQGVNSGFSFESMGISTTILFHRHNTRILGLRVIMLFGNDSPTKAGITGVMLRFSDDTARPVASQVLARRIGDQSLSKKWDDAVEDCLEAEKFDANFRAPNDIVDALNQWTRVIDEKNDPDDLLEVYEAFSLKHHAKAFDGKQWDETAEYLKLSGAELEARLLQTQVRSHRSGEE